MADPTEADINSVCEMLEAYDTRDRQMFSRALKVRIRRPLRSKSFHDS